MCTSTLGRRVRETAVALGIAAVTCLAGTGLAPAAPAAALPTAPAFAPALAPGGQQAVDFHGYRTTVPTGWPVVDLARQPTACVRYDRPAVYLGHPGAQQNCPAHLVGRTDTLLIEPLDRVAAARVDGSTATAAPGRATPAGTPVSRDGQITVAVPDAGMLVTATHGENQTTVRGILGRAEDATYGRLILPVRRGDQHAGVGDSDRDLAVPGYRSAGRRRSAGCCRRRAAV